VRVIRGGGRRAVAAGFAGLACGLRVRFGSRGILCGGRAGLRACEIRGGMRGTGGRADVSRGLACGNGGRWVAAGAVYNTSLIVSRDS
jgi:hypothetical protein